MNRHDILPFLIMIIFNSNISVLSLQTENCCNQACQSKKPVDIENLGSCLGHDHPKASDFTWLCTASEPCKGEACQSFFECGHLHYDNPSSFVLCQHTYWSHNYYTIHYYFSIKKWLEVYGNKVLIIRLRTKTSSLISWTKKIELFPFTKSAAFDIMWQCLRNNFFYIDPVIFYINEAFVDYKLKFNVLLKKKTPFLLQCS